MPYSQTYVTQPLSFPYLINVSFLLDCLHLALVFYPSHGWFFFPISFFWLRRNFCPWLISIVSVLGAHLFYNFSRNDVIYFNGLKCHLYTDHGNDDDEIYIYIYLSRSRFRYRYIHILSFPDLFTMSSRCHIST